MIQESNEEIQFYEDQMAKIQASASLFEVNMPEFKPLKQCRRELRMLKVYAYQPIKYLNTLVFMTVNKFFFQQLWDYTYLVRNYIENWKKTPWRKVDVETMDIECKKFAKEIRGRRKM